MKNAKLIPLLLLLAMAGVGCSSKSSNDGSSVAVVPTVPQDNGPVIPGGNGGTDNGTVGYGTNSVQFTPVSFAEMNSYVALHPLNAPSNFKVTVDTQRDSGGHYYGQVRIAYDDTGVHYEAVFDSGSGANPNIGNDYADGPFDGKFGWKQNSYNYWLPGNAQFSGFFSDAYGAVVLVIEGNSSTNQGDGQGGETTLKGSIWYKNFPTSYAPQSPYYKCWFITNGPYNCRSAALTGSSKSSAALEPSDTYRKLGTFIGLSRSQAFKPYQ